jgi:hypothetical protein
MIQEMTGVLNGLRSLELTDLQLYKDALNQVQRICWHQYFPYLYFRYEDLLICEEDGSVCLFYRLNRLNKDPKLFLYFLPMPMNEKVLKRCLDRVRAYNNTKKAEICRVDEQELAILESLGADIQAMPLESEYVYAPKNYRSLAGAKHHKLRQDINRIMARDNVEVRDFVEGDRKSCIALMDEWAVIQQDKYDGPVAPRGFARRCVRHSTLFNKIDLFGLVVVIDGNIRSVGFAGEIRRGLANLFITYSDHNYFGLNRFLFYQFMLKLDEYDLVNYAGAATKGLQFAKESLRPVMQHGMYRVQVIQ